MKKKLIKRAIFFMISCNMVVFTPTWASQEIKNTITSSSIEVSDGSIKNIVNDDINIIDTNVRDEYGIFSNNGGKLNIDVDSLTIEHNIDRSNMFTSILSQGNTSQGSRSLIDIKTINDINIDNTAQELEQINAINAKDNANLNLLSKNGDININSNLNINRRLYDVNNSIINVENNSALKLDAKNMNINSTITDSYGQRLFNNYGINVKNSQLNINNQENMQINSTISGRGFDNYGVYVYDNLNQGSKVDIVNNGDLIINTNDNSSRNHSYGIFVINENNTDDETSVNINSKNNVVNTKSTGIEVSGELSNVNITASAGSNVIKALGDVDSTGIEVNDNGTLYLNAKDYNIVTSDYTGIHVSYADDKQSNITLNANNNIVNAVGTGILSFSNGNINLNALNGNNAFTSNYIGISLMDNSQVNLKADKGENYFKIDEGIAILSSQSNVLAQANKNILEGIEGISSIDKSEVKLQAIDSNTINAKEFGIYTKEQGVVNLNATNANNTVYVDGGYGISGNNSAININSQSGNNSIEVAQGIAIEANNGSNISVNANKGQNNIKSSDIAISVNKNNIDKDIATTSMNTVIKITGKDNIINATTAIDNIDGGNVEIIASENNSINGLVHAENKANTKIQGKVNYLKNDNGQSIIWADAGTIDITGTSIIQANSQQVALLANNDMNNLNQGIITASFGQNSVIKGDIIAKDNGLIKLNVSNSNDDVSGLIIDGNILAENQGNISLDIGNNSLITGNINDYSYLADLNNQNLKQENLAGNISIDFNNKSRWNVVGQSFISKINTKENNIIDMVGYNTENKPHSLMVKEFNGDSNFVMNLNGNRQNTDMVYLNSGTGNYNVILANAVTKNDIGQNGLRFATVGDKNKQVFKNAVAYNDGFFNIKYQIASEDYDVNNEENTLYNNGDNSDLLTENRPSNNIINNIFGNNEDAVNYKLVNIEEKTLSNAGKTILNMTKANYDVAVFMGRLDKRMGDVHYLNKNDDGIWFRLRHDRIEKDLGYTVDGNMYELGYDKLFLKDNGQERLGLAFDYMKGSTSYDDIAGKGNNSRKGIWLYDTWIGDDGHYSDYILKWGHLENDFEIAGTKKLNLIKGNYDNDVFSASAEYGYMKNLKNDWYITPQVQLQLAKVTGADYITNQNTNVHVDDIDSIIGRAGFKLGRNFGDNKKNTFYLKADVLREFLGEQFVSVKDVTSDNEYVGFKYDHSGYWYDVGFGFNIETKKDSYAFLDVERRFGNGNKNSYQINGGFYWAL
ncbi:autotransporter outer membrane beta-barrel domain-containing protein [Megamonas funiformis]|uniref:autotransporter outer membrane beta-barrel domain-containing protein n=2 Tax=Megamonas funiformis TaxID=437897 RepID=UPI00195A1D91|nr:autotransporter outer membrane beta-barrel domain-containing protein [Megamonas funiformis]MBM6650717.1 autotransporter outer membrane beta-barrel domain-containing protein [Megamonas funiformis]